MKTCTSLFLLLAAALWCAGQDPRTGGSGTPSEPRIAGNLDIGGRWLGKLRGSPSMYRTMVNLGEGPKLFQGDIVLNDPARRLFDKLTFHGNNWGGDPYTSLRAEASRIDTYRFAVDYRNIAYFSDIPSFANPNLGRGILDSQRTYNLRRRMIDTRLELFPSRRITPYFGYSRDWGEGNGVTLFTSDFNEYVVATSVEDKTDTWFGGVRFDQPRFHLTLEQGGSRFSDLQHLRHKSPHYGNLTTTFLGQRLFLSELDQSERIDGDNVYSKAIFTSRPTAKLDLHGQFLYSRPRRDVSYRASASGRLFSYEHFVFYGSENRFYSAEGRLPHSAGSFSLELRLLARLRIQESVMSDRFHVPARSTTDELVLRTSAAGAVLASDTAAGAVEPVELKYNRQEVNLLLDLTGWLTFRGGHRFSWGDALVRAPALSQTGRLERGELAMHTALAGLYLRPNRQLSLSADLEAGSANRNYFRTALHDYQKLAARVRYQLAPSIQLSANLSLLNNLNPAPEDRFEFRNRDYSFTLTWTPQGGKWVSLLGDYTYSTLRSQINYLIPQQLSLARSVYLHQGRVATGLLDFSLPQLPGGKPQFSLGGSFYSGTGSRPARYYQPLGRVLLPLHTKVTWVLEWRWYGHTYTLYPFEEFRVHTFSTGLRLNL